MKTLATTCTLGLLFFNLAAPANAQLAGGWSKAKVDDPDVVAAAKFAVKETAGEKGGLKLDGVLAASQQVVAGINYSVDLKVVDRTGAKPVERRATAVVYRNLDDVQKLTSWTWRDLPRVLIIGDSISLGYTPFVVEQLKGRAVVVHNRGNAQHTGTGLQKLDAWLGEDDWDVVHFNWGLWDLCYRHPESKTQGRRDKERGTITTSLEQYEKNLDELAARLKKTNAKLIWANTTTVPEGEAGRKLGDDDRYNEVAARVMKKHGIPVNDLNALTDTFPANLFTAPGNVHYTPEGSKKLAAAVAEKITAALEN